MTLCSCQILIPLTESKRDESDDFEIQLVARESCFSFMSIKGCNDHGDCKDDRTGPHCVCEAGYEGVNCQTREYSIHLPYPL